MNHQIPKVLQFLSRKLSFLAIPNLGFAVCALAAIAFVAKTVGNTPYERFLFDPAAVMAGEWWRFFPVPIWAGLDNPIFLLFFVLFIYFVIQALESAWGTALLTLFVLLSYLACVGASLITQQPISIWFYIAENLALAFGTTFPDYELYLYFVLKVKAKWLALLSAVIILFQFLTGDYSSRLFLVLVLAPYLLFFGPHLAGLIRTRMRKGIHQKKWDSDMWR
ncbi:MAG: hypothetical protein HY537_18315 [Deltaproteobacteria bacterium]|nr:hypothetical protein [Deltaproteobacteria bacterium]